MRRREQIERLLLEGLKSHYEISVVVGVPVVTVLNVESELSPKPPILRAVCPDCGMLVVLPCCACEAQAEAKSPSMLEIVPPLKPIGLDLKPNHYKRYVAVLKRRGMSALVDQINGDSHPEAPLQ